MRVCVNEDTNNRLTRAGQVFVLLLSSVNLCPDARVMGRGPEQQPDLNGPSFCFVSSYALMRECWDEDPYDRPTFTDLVYILSDMADNTIKHVSISKELKIEERLKQVTCRSYPELVRHRIKFRRG